MEQKPPQTPPANLRDQQDWSLEDHIKITDPETQQALVDKRG